MAQIPPQPLGGNQDPVAVQLDPNCLRSILKEFLVPLKTNDPRTDFFLSESEKFHRDYVKSRDGILNTSVIFGGFLSVITSSFFIYFLSKIQRNPNDPNSPWSGLPAGISPILPMLLASFSISLTAASLAVDQRHRNDKYLQSRGGSAADENQDRQQKVDWYDNWHFNLAIKGPPIMFHLATMLLWAALLIHLVNIYRAAT